MATNLHATHFRFGADDGTEVTHTFLANLDTNVTLDEAAIFLLRLTVQETGGTAAANTDVQFQCSLNGGAFQNITTSSTICKAVAVGAFANGDTTTRRLTGTGTFESSNAGCTEDGSSGGTADDIAASGNMETEAGLQLVAANLVNGDSVTFKLTSPDFTITNDVVPTITVTAADPKLVTPGVASLSLSAFAPTVTVSDNKSLTPGTATLSLTAFAPSVTVSDHKLVTPGVATLTLAAFAPTVSVAAAGVSVTPGTASLTLTTFAPTVTATSHIVVTPGLATLIATCFAPTVTATQNRLVTPGKVALVLTAFTPTVTISGGLVLLLGKPMRAFEDWRSQQRWIAIQMLSFGRGVSDGTYAADHAPGETCVSVLTRAGSTGDHNTDGSDALSAADVIAALYEGRGIGLTDADHQGGETCVDTIRRLT